jgi:lysozyme family protein
MAFTHQAEGGYVAHPADRGGPTNWGFSLRFLRRIGFDADHDGDTDREDVRLMQPNQARLLYRLHFWEPARADRLPWPVSPLVFDAAVHHGQGRSIRMLQQGINIQARELLTVDGLIGPLTLRGIKRVNPAQLGRDMLDLRRQYMRAIVADDPTQADFIAGWLARVEALEEAAGLSTEMQA